MKRPLYVLIDYQTENVLGREETAATVQLDFSRSPKNSVWNIPPKMVPNISPSIIHRAPLGTHEISFLS